MTPGNNHSSSSRLISLSPRRIACGIVGVGIAVRDDFPGQVEYMTLPFGESVVRSRRNSDQVRAGISGDPRGHMLDRGYDDHWTELPFIHTGLQQCVPALANHVPGPRVRAASIPATGDVIDLLTVGAKATEQHRRSHQQPG